MKQIINTVSQALKDNRLEIIYLCAIGILLGSADVVHAVTAPAAGSFAYDIYDIGVNKILGGPIGFVAGVGAIVVGAISAVQQKVFAAVPAILGGAGMLNADSIVESLGLMIN